MKATNLVMMGSLTVLLAVALSGCADGDAGDIEQLRAFLQAERAPVSAEEYRVYPPDVLTFRSVHVPEIEGETQQVRPDGKVNLPMLGEVEVAGKTPREIEEAIMLVALDYYEEVDATVQVTGYNSQKVFVMGQVNSPGGQPWTGRDTLLDVLSRAYPNRLAWPEKVKVLRCKERPRGGYIPTTQPAEEAETEGLPEVQEMTIDLVAMMEDGDLSRNVMLQPDDVVYVPPDPFARVGLALEKVLYPVRPTLEAIRVPGTIGDAAETGQ